MFNLGKFCLNMRTIRGDMTQQSFAEKVGLSRPTVGFYESGERLPDAERVYKICNKNCISSDWLLDLPSYYDMLSKIPSEDLLCELLKREQLK